MMSALVRKREDVSVGRSESGRGEKGRTVRLDDKNQKGGGSAEPFMGRRNGGADDLTKERLGLPLDLHVQLEA